MKLRFGIIGLAIALSLATLARGQTAEADGDYIRDWLIAGPFSEQHMWLVTVANAFGPGKLSPEEGQPALSVIKGVPAWTRYQAVGSQVNLIDALGQHEDVGALAFTLIHADETRPATFYLGSDDQARVWVNDRLVYRFDEGRPLWPDEDSFTVELRAGENRCFVFVAQGPANWGFTLRASMEEERDLVPVVWDVADLKGQERELYTPHWRYLAGDDPQFADPEFDDSSWSPVQAYGYIDGVEDEPVVWFRTQVWCTRALVNLWCHLSATDVGRSQFYLDGQRIVPPDDVSSEYDGSTIPFRFTAERQLLAVRLERDPDQQASDRFRYELKMTAAKAVAILDEERFEEFADDLRSETSLAFHRLILMFAILLFLIFHSALLYYYPRRAQNLAFCITLCLSLITLGVLHLQEAVEGRGLSSQAYWVFVAMVSVSMLSAIALAHVVWRKSLSIRTLLAWAVIATVFYAIGYRENERNWSFIMIPLSTLECWRVFLWYAWRRISGAWIFGVGLACFTVAQLVNTATTLNWLEFSPEGLCTNFWAYGFVAFLACMSIYIGKEFAASTRKLEELTANLETRVEKYARQLEKKHLAQARLETLRYQLNPHFLYNALNSVEALSRDAPARIPDIIQRLCECLRYSLDTSEDGTATLQEELNAIGSYLRVEQIRFEEQLKVTIDVTPEARELHVPELLLQPLVENAIKYGMRTSEMPLQVVIAGKVDEGALHIEVRNTGEICSSNHQESGYGIGLSNTRKRLELIYDSQQRLFLSAADGWVTVKVKIPLDRAE